MRDRIAPETLAKIRQHDEFDLRMAVKLDDALDDTAWERHVLLAEVDRLNALVKGLRSEAEREEQTTGNLIDERDNFHALLDRFAAAVAPIEVIGEHSSGNDPWLNALDMVTPAAEVDRLRAQVSLMGTYLQRESMAAIDRTLAERMASQ